MGLAPGEKIFYFFKISVLVLISVKTGLSLGPWANVVIDLRVEIAFGHFFTRPEGEARAYTTGGISMEA